VSCLCEILYQALSAIPYCKSWSGNKAIMAMTLTTL